MAKIVAGIGTSHTPAIGAAVDNGRRLRAVETVDGGDGA
jgi:hypothetical protein